MQCAKQHQFLSHREPLQWPRQFQLQRNNFISFLVQFGVMQGVEELLATPPDADAVSYFQIIVLRLYK